MVSELLSCKRRSLHTQLLSRSVLLYLKEVDDSSVARDRLQYPEKVKALYVTAIVWNSLVHSASHTSSVVSTYSDTAVHAM
jgi:hypothetical protein